MPPSKDEDATLNFILDEVTQINRKGAPDKSLLARKAQNWDRKLAALEHIQNGAGSEQAKAELKAVGAMGFAQIGPGIFAPTAEKKRGLIAHELTHVSQARSHQQAGVVETIGTLRKKVAPLLQK